MPWPIGLRYIGLGASGGVDALVDQLLQLRVEAQAAVADGEVNPRQALVELGAEEGDLVDRPRGEFAQQLRRRER